MAVTSDSAKIHFNIGSFNVDTTLTIPSDTLKNRASLEIQELINPQLSGWGDTPLSIYALLSVTFEGTVIYANSQYGDASYAAAPTDPDVTILPVSGGATETYTVNNTFPIILDNQNLAAKGKYIVSVKFVYWANDVDFGFTTGTFTANLDYEQKQPVLSHWYDQLLPKLSISDSEQYIIGSVDATTETEFVLSPPQNRAEITNTYSDIQSVSYSTFWTGGNEVTYTVLINYDFGTYSTTSVEQAYDSFPIYYVDWCAISTCMGELYNLATGANCSTKSQVIYQQNWLKATSLTQQIQLGQGCGSDKTSALIEQLNDILDCDCGCLDETPREINSPSTVSQTNIQEISSTGDDTAIEIDLSAGTNVYLTLAVNGGDTEVSVINIEANTEYRFIFIRAFGTQDVSFSAAQFQDGNGALATTTVNNTDLIMTFFSRQGTKLTLESRNDI